MWSFFSRDSTKDFPYEIGEQVSGFDGKSVWSLHKAKKKNTNDEVSVFVYDIRSGSDVKLDIAKSSVKRLKTLRHPSILQFIDSLETDKVLYVATEYVEPLGVYLANLAKDGPQKDLYLTWGIFQITVCANILNNLTNDLFELFYCSVHYHSLIMTVMFVIIMYRRGQFLLIHRVNGNSVDWSMYLKLMEMLCHPLKFHRT